MGKKYTNHGYNGARTVYGAPVLPIFQCFIGRWRAEAASNYQQQISKAIESCQNLEFHVFKLWICWLVYTLTILEQGFMSKALALSLIALLFFYSDKRDDVLPPLHCYIPYHCELDLKSSFRKIVYIFHYSTICLRITFEFL